MTLKLSKSAMQTEVLGTRTPGQFALAVKRAAELLRRGELVALPTETVYGLAANALDPQAVGRIFAAKRRPLTNPIIVHVCGLDMAKACVSGWPGTAQQLAESFWPGPLTLVLPRGPSIPDVVTAGGPTVGVRWPSHPFIEALISECGFPLAAPSANLAARLSPTSAEHVRKTIGSAVPLIVDGGPSAVGIESTVLDLTMHPPRVLRPGMVHEGALLSVLGELAACCQASDQEAVPRSPGLMPKHYAPEARLVVWAWRGESELDRLIAKAGCKPAECCVLAHTRVPRLGKHQGVSLMPREAKAFARALYAELHWCDEQGARLIAVEAPPAGIEWKGIRDRLRRAAS
jgi:L-threonylcarbamoyladenylate synthase